MKVRASWYLIIDNNIDLALASLLVICGLMLMAWQYQKPGAAAVATLVGALFGGVALLLGNWINRNHERRQATEALDLRRVKLKTLITTELVNVAAGLIDTKYRVDAALTTLNVGGYVDKLLDMTSYYPRDMPLTDRFSVELLIFEQPEIDLLATLRSNLMVTRMSMEEVTRGVLFGLPRITRLSRELGHSMNVLADTFEHIAPRRQLTLPDRQAELATVILRRMGADTLQGTAA